MRTPDETALDEQNQIPRSPSEISTETISLSDLERSLSSISPVKWWDGIVATHNAADVLIEIAKAALALEAAKAEAAKTRRAYALGETRATSVDAADRVEVDAARVFRAALAKVQQ